MYGETNDKLSENEDEALTSEDEQSDDGDAEADEPVANKKFHRRHKKYAISSIATSIDEISYDMIDFDNVKAKEVDVPLEKKGQTITKKITWTTPKPKQIIRLAPQNIIPNTPGVKPEFRGTVDPFLAWATFIDENMMQMIVSYTNQSINESIRHSKQKNRAINCTILSKPTKERSKHSLGFGIFGDFSTGHFMI